MDNLDAFLQQYFDGELKAYLKSEPIPESNDGPVKVRASPCGRLCATMTSHIEAAFTPELRYWNFAVTCGVEPTPTQTRLTWQLNEKLVFFQD